MWRYRWLLLMMIYCPVLMMAQGKNNPAPAGTGSVQPLAVLPFQLVNDNVVVTCLYSGSADTLHFIFDTGAEVTTLHNELATKLQLQGNKILGVSGITNGMSMVETTTLNALYFKQLRLPFVKVYLENLSQFNTPWFKIDGIIGVDLLKKYIIKINHRQQQLEFYRTGKTPSNITGQLIPFRLNFATPAIDAAIQLPNGQIIPGRYHFTSGGNYGILFNFPFVNKHKLDALLPTINTDRVQDMLKTIYYVNSNIPSLEIGSLAIKKVPISYCKDVNDGGAFSEIAGSIGYDVWKHFNITINYAQKEIYLESIAIVP
jgi:hypothetical protein